MIDRSGAVTADEHRAFCEEVRSVTQPRNRIGVFINMHFNSARRTSASPAGPIFSTRMEAARYWQARHNGGVSPSLMCRVRVTRVKVAGDKWVDLK